MNAVVIFLGLFYLAGLGVLAIGLWSAWHSMRAGSWPTSQGTINSAELVTNAGSEDGSTYEVKVHYSYRVGGVPYTGTRLAFGYTATGGQAGHAEILQRLQAAKTVDVHYDPFDPSNSCLSYGIHRTIQFTLTFALMWLAFVTAFALMVWLTGRSDSVLLHNLSVK